MGNSENALLLMETGQTQVTFEALTDSGDRQTFTPSEPLISGKQGYAPVVRLNGIHTGNKLVTVAASGSDNVVDSKAFSAYSQGFLMNVTANTDEAVTRPVADNALITSVQMTSAGTISMVAGAEGASSAFSETRGVAGGPPFILADSVEIAQIRVNTSTDAPITAAQIFQEGQYTEYAAFPVYDIDRVGQGIKADSESVKYAHVKFASQLPASHTGDTPRNVYMQYSIPGLTALATVVDYKPAEDSHSISSKQVYGKTIASRSKSLGQGGFKAILGNGITDDIVKLEGQNLTFKFFSDRDGDAYQITQGVLGNARTYPAGDHNESSCTISAETTSVGFES